MIHICYDSNVISDSDRIGMRGFGMRNRFCFLFCMVLFCLISSCVTMSSKQSGFLENYSRLQPDPEAEDLFFYENPKKKIYDYDAFMLAPILVYFDPAAVNHAVNPERLMEVTEYFRSLILRTFQGRYRIVPTAGPDVCTIRIAVTGVVPEKPRMVTNKNTEAFGLSAAALEVIFQDSITGEPVFKMWDTRQHGGYKRMNVESALRHAKNTIHNWTKTMMDYKDKAYADRPK